ncbi:hypothetical protein RM533_11845 [Croceicoccus sp. F390]|uniref:Glycosyl transferase family 2 n=1 Tax=Croceicoccus esteveae TaxID=3075597 RepID=A0ABU2ZJT5_9SPHN|nr:hypothetical protein [Croceicoccus sp. F390]MDT0576864.1 hypothetical protein [Croceicoccus sp. F390]
MAIRLISCVGVRNDLAMLPHFIRHYLALGIAPAHMHLILQASQPCLELDAAIALLHDFSLAEPELWLEPYTSDAMWEKRRAVQTRCADGADWVISADVDELHDYPAPLHEVLGWCDARSINCIQGPFIDRLAANGRLKPVVASPAVEVQFPIQAEVICAIRGGAQEPGFRYGTVKVMALKGDLMPSRGGHHPRGDGIAPRFLAGQPLAEFSASTRPAFRFAFPFKVHHYKWVATLVPGTRERVGTAGVSAAGKRYGELLLQRFADEERISFDDVAIRRPMLADRISWTTRVQGLRSLARAEKLIRRIRR